MEDCIFCKIINKDAPAYVIAEDATVIVFLSLENHPLVVTKQHIPNIYTLDTASAAAVMNAAVRIARAVKQGLGCDGVYLTQANEPAGGQDVFHFHMHIYPRWTQHSHPAPGERLSPAQMLDRIQRALGQVPPLEG